ncbi:VOC family protein [Flavisphingomonas formosensis]|uniref:VOC family protein n=1 Tax=Flavisphingomonas formosensis TaxID=861534 RepID=UPI0012F8DC55|nr:VOC family protein [Sphingomonas formosensis]
MAAKLQHIALQVADLNRSASFYQAAFGARIGTRPVPRSGPFVERLLDAPGSGIVQRGIHLALPGGGIELAQIGFGDDVSPPDERPLWQRRILHFCIEVDDVHAAAARAEAAGGRLQFPVNDQTGRPFVFVEDPDGHVIELISMTFDEAIETVHRFVPGSKPD